MTLIGNRYDGYILPTYDVGGSKEIKPNADLPIATPSDCTRQRLWINDAGTRCTSDIASLSTTPETFETYYHNGFPSEACTTHSLILDGAGIRSSGGWCDDVGGGGGTEGGGSSGYIHISKTYAYKKVLSVLEHKSPTDREYGTELKNFVTPSLPSDKDRYVDFISAKGNYVKIFYPNLFRIFLSEDEDVTSEGAQAKIKAVLDAKSAEINALIASEAPTSGGLYELLKNGAYPSSAKIDLYGMLASKPSMLESATDAVVWNNLDNATAKYAFALEHHVDIDGNTSYPLGGHKNDYEVSYIVGKGDAKNLYVKIDPASKDGPGAEVSEILKKSAELLATIDATNISSGDDGGPAEFKCGPPDGVLLPKWLPAIFCWLSTILPPTVSAGNCSPNSSADIADLISKHFGGDRNGDKVPDYQEDADKNGLIDGAEYVKDGAIRLSAVPKRVPYRESVALSAVLENKDGIQIYVDSTNEVSFDATRVVAYSGGVATEKYRRGASGELGNSSVVKEYVNFGQINVRTKEGKATYVMTTKDRDADVYFDATVAPRDKNGKAAFVKISNEAKLEIRSESLKPGLTSSGASISSYAKAGEYSEISFPLRKIGKGGTDFSVTLPVTVRVYDDDTSKQVGGSMISGKDVFTYTGQLLKQSGNYRFEFTDKDGVMGSQAFTVAAGKAVKMELSPSSTLFVKNESVTVLARVVDEYGNYAKGDLIHLSAKVTGGGYFVENKASELKKTILEGFTTFEISTSDGGKDLSFEIEAQNRGISAKTDFRSIDYAKAVVEVENRDSFVVGKAPHAVKVKVVDKDGKTLTGFHGVAAVNFPKLSGTFDTNFVAIQDGLSSTGFVLTPKYVAAENLRIDVRIPGVRDVEGDVLTVYPDVPMRVALETEKPSIEARIGGETEKITAKLFDRYGNLAYNHGSGAFTAKFSIPNHFQKNLRFVGDTYVAESKFNKGIATTEVQSTRMPGTPYVIVEVTPGLESNSYTVTDESGKTLTVTGYSKNAVAVDTYYL
ncbi:MAG: hypothetical protein QG650_1020, partial [Patescibacteria group bacterium]|nr:hypothetical protein [Patescibacteria group bacterium]